MKSCVCSEEIVLMRGNDWFFRARFRKEKRLYVTVGTLQRDGFE
jgi:hypothetical protein